MPPLPAVAQTRSRTRHDGAISSTAAAQAAARRIWADHRSKPANPALEQAESLSRLADRLGAVEVDQ